MGLTVGTRTTTTGGGSLTAVGLALSLGGVIRSQETLALAGVSLTLTSGLIVTLGFIYRWMTDTRAERRALAAAQDRAQEERQSYFALKAANEAEMTRLHRDVVAERANNAAALAVERTAMYAQLERDRFQIQTKAFRTGVMFERAGLLEPDAPVPSNIISFPLTETPSVEPQERSREHGVVGP
ncbi:hypothetical protein [Streptomyces sp. 1222.5]|uniref:hypothetical protein n=1 Tax=Streptomyces sp. 1222.5 TaxID=1881026 RepID=UPI003EBD16B1